MLTTLRIENFALVEKLELDFSKGLSIVSGETGSGKSILMNAIGVVLGGRGRSEFVREGTAKAIVEARFELRRHSEILRKLTDSGLQSGDELVIRRQITKSGRSTSYVNGALVTAQMLSFLTSDLVDISGQHAHYSLLRTDQHLVMLDRICQLESLSKTVETQYADLAAVSAQIEELKQQRRDRSDREAFLLFQLTELREAELEDSDEEENLETEAKRLRNLERIQNLSETITQRLYTQTQSAMDLIGQALKAIEELTTLDPQLNPTAQDLTTSAVLVEECYRSITQYRDRLEGEPARLSEIEERLTQLAKLRQKYGVTLADVIHRRDELEEELLNLSSSDEQLTKAMAIREKQSEALIRSAEQLSAARRSGGEVFVASVEQELQDLGMKGAKLGLNFTALASGLQCGNQFVGPRGLEQVEFLISTNEGERIAPLSRIASGGELSRIMLAVKRVMAEQDPVEVYIFDEVDAGVGGVTAKMIGQKLAKVAQLRQAICVTHLAQIAALGDQHFAVEKISRDGRTYSQVTALEGNTRVAEIARMLGGKANSESAKNHAVELLDGQ
ncbi:MAG: DNA repair protein RecN [Bradymonadia bacterium]